MFVSVRNDEVTVQVRKMMIIKHKYVREILKVVLKKQMCTGKLENGKQNARTRKLSRIQAYMFPRQRSREDVMRW